MSPLPSPSDRPPSRSCRPNRLRRQVAPLGILGAGMLLVLAGCGDDAELPEARASERPVTVQIAPVELETVRTEREWSGQLEPLRVLPIEAPREGRVVSVEVRDGDPVREGELLVRMEGPEVSARRAVIEERRAQLEEELERWERLAAQGAAGPGEVTQARLRLLEAREESAAIGALAETYQLRAPVAGRVVGTTVDPGSEVSGGHVLLQVEGERPFGIRLSIPAGETHYLEALAFLSVEDGRGTSFEVERVVLASDLHPTFVRADVLLRDGGEAGRGSGRLRFERDEEVLLIPWTAVASDDDRSWVARLTGEDPHRVERRTVELGRPFSGGIEVLSGLEAGDRVIRYEPRSHPEGRAVAPPASGGGEGS